MESEEPPKSLISNVKVVAVESVALSKAYTPSKSELFIFVITNLVPLNIPVTPQLVFVPSKVDIELSKLASVETVIVSAEPPSSFKDKLSELN